MKAYKIDDKEKAIEMIKNTAAAQIRNGKSLALLPQLASVYNSTEGDESDKLLVIEGDGRLDDLMKLYKIDDKAKAIEMIKNTAAAQERRQEGLVLFNQLVSRFSRAGSRDNGRSEIRGSDLDRLVELSLGSQEEVVAKIEKEAMKCDETFWDKYKELKAVKNKHMVEIEDDNGDTHYILFVKPTEKGKDGTSVLYQWFAEQVKYSGISGTNNTDAYAVKAYKRVGSLEYQALVELGVSFDDKLNKLAHDAIRSEGHKKISGGKQDLIDPSLKILLWEMSRMHRDLRSRLTLVEARLRFDSTFFLRTKINLINLLINSTQLLSTPNSTQHVIFQSQCSRNHH